MANVVARNGRQALVETAREVMRWGEKVEPRGMLTKELRHFSVEIDDPYDVLCTGIGANQSPEVAASEAIQLVGGFSDPAFSVAHAPNLANFLNDVGTFDGAYGPRVEATIYDVLQRLVSDVDTRQAIIPIWTGDDARRWGSKDYPCTLTLGFFLRKDKLELDVTMRSNDVNWGLKNDIFQFTQLQLSVAHLLDVEAGPYRHTSYSMHLYERDWGWAEGLSQNSHAVFGQIADHPAGIDGAVSVLDMLWRARAIALNADLTFGVTDGIVLTPSERWYRKALGW